MTNDGLFAQNGPETGVLVLSDLLMTAFLLNMTNDDIFTLFVTGFISPLHAIQFMLYFKYLIYI